MRERERKTEIERRLTGWTDDDAAFKSNGRNVHEFLQRSKLI